MSGPTTSYGTWYQHFGSLGPQYDVDNYISGGDADWRERCESTGALAAMVADYREAVEALLPKGVSLVGDEFIGPYYADDTREQWQDLNLRELAEERIDMAAIVERHDPDNA